MKKLIAFLIFTGMVWAASAQNESYRGGIADGHSTDSIISFPQSASILMFAPFRGSIADGYAADSIITYAQNSPALQFAPYLGSIADGHAADSIINFPQYASILMFAPFLGSIADGYGSDSSLSFPQHGYITMYQPYSGGQADGWSGYPAFNITIVPVGLLSFTGEQQGKQHLLRWVTTQEQNTSHFELQRSADGIRFSKLGEVAAAGNSTVIRNYDYADGTPMQGNNFYRLKIFDNDGSSKFSNIILLKVQGNTTITVYPNPATKTLHVVLGGSGANKTARAEIFDVNGKLVQSKSFVNTNGNFSFDVDRLAGGVYVLRIIRDSEPATVWRFIKQ